MRYNDDNIQLTKMTYLVGPANEVHVMFVEELGHNIRTKSERDTTVILSPAHDIFIGVSPEQITQQTLVRNVCGPHHTANLFHRLQVWRKTWVKNNSTAV